MTQKVMLVVDDDDDFLQLFCARLASMVSAQIMRAQDGEQAYVLIRDNPAISVLICDCMMPALDGLSLKERLNAEFPHREIHTVVVSGYGTESLRDLARSLGISRWLDKPIEDEQLTLVISDSAQYLT